MFTPSPQEEGCAAQGQNNQVVKQPLPKSSLSQKYCLTLLALLMSQTFTFNLFLSLHNIQILWFYFIVLICFFCVVFRFLKLSFIAASCLDLSALLHPPSCTTYLKKTTFLNPFRSSIFLIKRYDLELSKLPLWSALIYCYQDNWGFLFMFTKKLFLRVHASFLFIVCVCFFWYISVSLTASSACPHHGPLRLLPQAVLPLVSLHSGSGSGLCNPGDQSYFLAEILSQCR